MTLSPIQRKILEKLNESDEAAWFYKPIEEYTGRTRKELKPIMDGLRDLHLVEHTRGLLLDGENGYRGSGFMILSAGKYALDEARSKDRATIYA